MENHASGFESQLEGIPTPPMRVSLILDSLEITQSPANYVAVIEEIRTVVRDKHNFVNIYHVNELTLETLLYLPQYKNFQQIHESTIWFLSDKEQKNQRECSVCGIT